MGFVITAKHLRRKKIHGASEYCQKGWEPLIYDIFKKKKKKSIVFTIIMNYHYVSEGVISHDILNPEPKKKRLCIYESHF